MTARTVVERLRRADPRLSDGLMAAVVAAALLISAALDGRKPGEPHLTVAGAALLLAQSAPLVWRRTHPVLVCLVVGVATGVYGAADYPDPLLPLGALIALYTVAAYTERRVSVTVLAVTAIGILAANTFARDADALDYFAGYLLTGTTWLMGEHQRTRRAYAAEEARQAVGDERARIARELHDVVAHHVSMIVVQSEAAASAAGDTGGADAFDAIAASGRQALTELRRLLGFLREDGDRAPIAPQPDIDDLGALVEQVERAGLPVDLRVEGDPRPLPPAVGLSAYRIVQEALTNTVRHAGPAHAAVVVRYRDDGVELEVNDDGRGPAPGGSNGGHGLLGIRERVALFGGWLEAGGRPGGGFAVRARLPIQG